jgi:Tol biopolymer transport system component/Ca2+-binding RTX toxin-like protein
VSARYSNLNILNSTITGNSGGIFNDSSTVSLKNTIVAGNVDSDCGGYSPFNGNANNLIGLTGASGTIGTGTDITFASAGITNINQVLDTTLRNNGGLTLTHALVAGSRAINAGNNTLIPADTNDMDGDGNTTEQLPVDQRGTSFNRIAGSTVDIGAFEVQGAAIPTVSVNNVSITEGNSGTKNLTFTVALNATSTGTITVDYATANGTAIAGNDYAPINGTLTFTAGQTSKTLTVGIIGDPVLEDNETFLLNLLNPSSNVVIANGVATGTITNDETLNIRRISVSSNGTQGNDNSSTGYTPSISADGRYITFSSDASNLVAGDTNGYTDIFVYDRQTSQTTRVSVSSSGTEGDNSSSNPSISADGRYVTFESYAYNLVAGDTDYSDIFVYDRQTSQTSRVSVSSSGAQANSYSSNPSISGDGRYVTFASDADNLVAGDTNYSADIFVYDRQTSQTRRVSVSSSGTQGNYDSSSPSISGDGRYVTFQSDASNLVAGDTNYSTDIFVYDRQTSQTSLVSVSSSGTQGNVSSSNPSISADGRYVTFQSYAYNLVAGDTTYNSTDIFVYDRQTGQTSRVSVSSSGTEANSDSSSPSISADGRYVTFQSGADNLVAGDTNGYADVFVYDRQLGQTTRISANASNVQGDDDSDRPIISSDGRYVAFQSEASNLVSGDTNGVSDVFVYDSGINATVPSVTLTLSPSAVSEDGSTNLVYTFTRLGLSTSPLTVNYTVGGTATFNTDYSQTGAATFTATTGTITFAAGSSLATLTINPTADTTPEANETVALTLTAGTGYSVSTPSAVTGTINDDDNKITLTVSPTSVNEDGATNLVYTFTRTNGISSPLVVNYTVGGTATFNGDYTAIGATSFTATAGTLTFVAGSSTATLTLDPTADTAIEVNETVALTLATGTGYGIATTSAVTGTINNDDLPIVSINNITVVEGLDNTATLLVSLNSPINQTVSVNYTTTAINATANTDYTSATGTLTIPANSTLSAIIIPILNDDISESTEAFTVNLSNPINATLNANASVGEVLISDTWYSALNRTLPNGVENLTLIGVNAINGTGNSGNNILTGNSANNTLNGGTGVDTLIGGLGNDIYQVDSTTDVITENANEGTDTIQSSVTFSLATFPDIENLTLTASSVINGTGNTANNSLTGNTANNTLDGGDGNDTLNGGAGNDSLIGGNGNDFAYYYSSTGSVTVNLATGTASDGLGGTDTLSQIEHIQGSNTAGDNLTGDANNNIFYGYGGNDTLNGGDGNDTLIGGTGNDTLTGGNGNDFAYYYTVTGPVTVNLATGTASDGEGGTDTLSQIENVQGSNTASDNLTGNTGVNVLYGYGGADILTGGGGNDLLYLGSDTVKDTVNYASGDGADTVYNFVRGAGGDILKFTSITAIDVQVSGSNTLFKVGDGISGNAGFGSGTLLLTTSATSGFGAADVNVNLLGATFAFS